MSLLLNGILRAKYSSCRQFPQKQTTDWMDFFYTSTSRVEYYEGVLSRERAGLPCVVWGSGSECHGIFMTSSYACNSL